MRFVMDMEFDEFLPILNRLNERQLEEKAWELWLSYPPQMKAELPFGEFLDGIKNKEEETTGSYIDQVFI